ncbi:hypothetical protein [Streptomyces sp. NPDC018693]|uniref:hypothetical protein n=1 Tax=unclassified Streptomyces TaxID=2593676 RepID=UPI00379645E1
MATAAHREGTAHGALLRWTRAAVIALVAALAVLVHHETAVAITQVSHPRASGTSSPAGLPHTATPATPVHPIGHTMAPGVTDTTTAHHDNGACSDPVTQHCSAAGVDSTQLTPPHQPSTGRAPALPSGAASGRDVPGTAVRGPPDLSVLSRFLL